MSFLINETTDGAESKNQENRLVKNCKKLYYFSHDNFK